MIDVINYNARQDLYRIFYISALLFIGGCLGYGVGKQRMKEEAISAGVASYEFVSKQNAQGEFTWHTNLPPVDFEKLMRPYLTNRANQF